MIQIEMLFIISDLKFRFSQKPPIKIGKGYEGESDYKAKLRVIGLELPSGDKYKIIISECAGISFNDKSVSEIDIDTKKCTKVIGGVYQNNRDLFIDSGGEAAHIYEVKGLDVRREA